MDLLSPPTSVSRAILTLACVISRCDRIFVLRTCTVKSVRGMLVQEGRCSEIFGHGTGRVRIWSCSQLAEPFYPFGSDSRLRSFLHRVCDPEAFADARSDGLIFPSE